jgi:plastocyanin
LVGALAIVTIRSMAFEPQVIVLQAGGTVRWVNADVVNHQISTGVVTRGDPAA